MPCLKRNKKIVVGNNPADPKKGMCTRKVGFPVDKKVKLRK